MTRSRSSHQPGARVSPTGGTRRTAGSQPSSRSLPSTRSATTRTRTTSGYRPRTSPAPRSSKAVQRAATSPKRRLLGLLLVILLAAGGLTYRMVVLQITSPEQFVAYGETQRLRTQDLPGRRGALLDRNGEQLAISIPQRTIWADPRLVTDKEGTALALSEVLDVSYAFLLERLTTDAAFVYLERQVDDTTAELVASYELAGVAAYDEPRRFNPSGSTLANAVIGQVGVDHEGLSGLELQFDDLLAGVAGEINLETAPDGRTIATGTRSETPAETGATLTLSLDRPLQFEVERMLIAQVEDMAAKGGVVVVMKPGTGEILAMASVVRDEDGDAVTTSENRAVTWSFEPGSITKPLTVAAIIEEGIASPDSVRNVPSSMQLYDRTFSDSSPHPDSMWTLTDILVKSSNVGTTMWAQELGPTKVDQYFRDFGFGELTSLDANFESTGVMPSLEEWSGVSIATIPIGQGISVTPIQMLTSLNTIANGGVYVPPVLVTGAVDGEGNEIELTEPDTHRVVSERTGATVREMMAQVVSSGTGKRAAVTGYQVAGKTGTAWKPFPNGGYGTPGNHLYIASFAGFLPAHAPELSILVTIDEPSNSIYGGSAAAPLFADIAEYAVRRFQIPPNVELVLRDVEVDTTSQPVEDGAETDPTDEVEVVAVEPPRVRGEAAVLPEPVEEEVVLLDDNGDPIPAAESETAESTGG